MRDCRADSAETQVACGGIGEKRKKKKKTQGRSLNGERLGMVGLRVERNASLCTGGLSGWYSTISGRRQTHRGYHLPQENRRSISQ